MKIYEIFSTLDSNYKNISNNPWVIRLEFNRRKMLNKKLNMNDIHLIVNYYFQNSTIIYSDDNAQKLIFRLKLNFKSSTKDIDNDYNMLLKTINDIKNITIKGLHGIDNVSVIENNTLIEEHGQSYETKQEYYISTMGSTLFDILCKEYVDSNRTISNDVNEIYETFGIEAAKFTIEKEINDVFKFSGQSTSPRHVHT